MGKIVSFATQKGGSGKSTLTLVLATSLAVDYNLKIAVLDCDYQQSIVKTRLHMDAENLEQLKESDPDASYPYDIFPMAMTKIFDFIDDPENSNKYDLIILDLPGRADANEIFDALTACDVVFVPLVSDYLDRASTADFMGILHSIKAVADKEGIDFSYYGLSTKRTNRREDKEMDEYIEQIGLSRLNSSLGLRAAYSRPSTLFSLQNPAFLRYAGGDKAVSDEIKSLCEEIIQKLDLPVTDLTTIKDATAE
ncbi:ParA family protein [Adhaeribacter rhizoryzae]|uniref:ParA family protein n=1 Tax=Adhaeribacter rhizoryzae TaxID=2607907 RepID=A0A5M6CWH4_9BACT|nr:ParA family protein [Adhaeribacter rhizoryzae]KAA5538740.1 ParA family protein [Adhaeribacter rhizoryzae]